MPVSNFAFKTNFGCKLQEVTHDIDGKQVIENWLVVEPNDIAHNTEKSAPYCFMGDANVREASILFNFAIGKQVGDDLYLLTSINGESQQSFEVKIQKKDGEKWVEDVEATKTFFVNWKKTGFLTAFHVNGVWNLELLTKVIVEEKVMLKDSLKCLFSKDDIPLELLAKTQEQYKAAVSHIKTGLPPKSAAPEVFEKLKALNTTMGLPSIVLRDAELEDDFGERSPCPAFIGNIPDSVEGLFSPKVTEKKQQSGQKSYGMKPEERMSFILSNFDNKALDEYAQKVFSHPLGYMKHLMLCQMTGLDVGFPSGLVSSAVHPLYINNGANNGHKKSEDTVNTEVENSKDTLQLNMENTVVQDDIEDYSFTQTDPAIEEKFDWEEYISNAELAAKEQKKIKECVEYCINYNDVHSLINWHLYVKAMEIDASTVLQKSRDTVEVKKYVCQTLVNLYKIMSSEVLGKNILQLPTYLLHNFQHSTIESLTRLQLNELQAKLSELDKRASIEEVSLAV